VVVKMVGSGRGRSPMNRSVRVMATCQSCGSEIVYAELNGETVRVCPECGELAEIVTVIEDSTDRGFDPTAYG
jgi:predicted RNA-binding Zn-ribbon protein involved in translation (DUF1610 family)